MPRAASFLLAAVLAASCASADSLPGQDASADRDSAELAATSDLDREAAENQLARQTVFSDLLVELEALGLDRAIVASELSGRSEGAALRLQLTVSDVNTAQLRFEINAFLAERRLEPGAVTIVRSDVSNDDLTAISLATEARIRELLSDSGCRPDRIYFDWHITPSGMVEKIISSDVDAMRAAVVGSELEVVPIEFVEWTEAPPSPCARVTSTTG